MKSLSIKKVVSYKLIRFFQIQFDLSRFTTTQRMRKFVYVRKILGISRTRKSCNNSDINLDRRDPDNKAEDVVKIGTKQCLANFNWQILL